MSEGKNKRFCWPIIGHSNIVSYLQKSLADGNVSHAYLFAGLAHVGKTAVVSNLVNALICENLHEKSGSIPCGQCQCCRQAANNIHPDIFWVRREFNEKSGKLKKNISIEQVRELQNRLNLHSFLDSYKVAVIEEAETLSLEAANSLLKTLEEPTPKTVIIMLTASIHSLPKTIISRCQVIKFLPVSSREIFDHLLALKIERKKAKFLAAISFGRPGIALDYINKPDNYAEFQDQARQFLALIKTDINGRFEKINGLVDWSDPGKTKEILIIWSKVLRDLLLIKNSAENLISNSFLTSDLAELAGNYSRQDLLRILAEINFSKRYLDANVSPRLALENLVLNF